MVAASVALPGAGVKTGGGTRHPFARLRAGLTLSGNVEEAGGHGPRLTVAALPKGQWDYCDARSTSSTVPDRRASPPKAAPVTPFWNLARASP